MLNIFKEMIFSLLFFTRLPFPFLSKIDLSKTSLSSTAWCFPIIGAWIGGLMWGVMLALEVMGLPFGLICILVIVLGVCITGALHEDGLADFCDGLGVHDRARALEVMRDSQVGTFGALALVASIGWRVVALYELETAFQAGLALFFAHIGARGFMTILMLYPLARTDGLASSVGGASLIKVLIALGITSSIFLAALPVVVFVFVLGFSLLGLTLVGFIALRRYGGMTGDIYGAGEQICECVILGVLASLVTVWI